LGLLVAAWFTRFHAPERQWCRAGVAAQRPALVLGTGHEPGQPAPPDAVADPAPGPTATARADATGRKPHTSERRPPAAPSPTASASGRPACDPPWVVDASGTKRYKLECL